MSNLALVPRTDEKLTPARAPAGAVRPGLAADDARRGRARCGWAIAAAPGDGVIGATGRVDGRPVACYAQDPSYMGGSLGEVHAETICRVLRTAGRARMPVVGFIESAGARLQEGVAALAGYARIFNQQRRAVGPGAADLGDLRGIRRRRLVLAGADGLRRDDQARVDVPHRTRRREGGHGRGRRRDDARRARGCTTETASASSSPTATSTRRGSCATCSTTCPSTPTRRRAAGRAWIPSRAPPTTPCPMPKRRVYDVRDVVRTLVDGGRLLEISPRWARNMLTGFARMDGRAVGIVANQPRYLGGVLDADCRDEGARASCAPATCTASRSSCSSTRPASCPAAARSSSASSATARSSSTRSPPRRCRA